MSEENVTDIVLGLLIKYEKVRNEFINNLTDDLFYLEREKILFMTIQELTLKSREIEIPLINEHLIIKYKDEAKDICPVSWFATLTDSLFTASNAGFYIDRLFALREENRLKEILQMASTQQWNTEQLETALHKVIKPKFKYIDGKELSLLTG